MKHASHFLLRLRAWLLASLFLTLGAQAQTPAEPVAENGNGAAQLRAKYQALQPQLANNPFKRRISLESTENPNKLAGDIYAVVDHPFAQVRDGMKTAGNWCEVLMLHLNTKHCVVQGVDSANPTLTVALGRKFDQPLSEATAVKFKFQQAAASADYLDARL